jgi:hypothetical protein
MIHAALTPWKPDFLAGAAAFAFVAIILIFNFLVIK